MSNHAAVAERIAHLQELAANAVRTQYRADTFFRCAGCKRQLAVELEDLVQGRRRWTLCCGAFMNMTATTADLAVIAEAIAPIRGHFNAMVDATLSDESLLLLVCEIAWRKCRGLLPQDFGE